MHIPPKCPRRGYAPHLVLGLLPTMPGPPHPVDAAIAYELDAIKRDIARNPEDPNIDIRLAALTERSAARELAHRREQAAIRHAERRRVLDALRQDREAGRMLDVGFHVLALASVVVGQVIERVALSIVGFHVAGGLRGVGRRRGWWG